MKVTQKSMSPPNNLPTPLSTFVGRQQELKEIARLLSTSRLLTLTGSGGVGKTRCDMALNHSDSEWARSLARTYDPESECSRSAWDHRLQS